MTGFIAKKVYRISFKVAQAELQKYKYDIEKVKASEYHLIHNTHRIGEFKTILSLYNAFQEYMVILNNNPEIEFKNYYEAILPGLKLKTVKRTGGYTYRQLQKLLKEYKEEGFCHENFRLNQKAEVLYDMVLESLKVKEEFENQFTYSDEI